MASATVTSVRDRLGVEVDDRLEFIESEQGFLVVAATRGIRTLRGIVSRLKKPVTIEDMNSAIAQMGGIRSGPGYEGVADLHALHRIEGNQVGNPALPTPSE